MGRKKERKRERGRERERERERESRIKNNRIRVSQGTLKRLLY